jgi:hypothetical protein
MSDWPFHVQKRPYREPESWYYLVVDRRSGASTMRRYLSQGPAQHTANLLNGVDDEVWPIGWIVTS